jgi:hypothetical protein
VTRPPDRWDPFESSLLESKESSPLFRRSASVAYFPSEVFAPVSALDVSLESDSE